MRCQEVVRAKVQGAVWYEHQLLLISAKIKRRTKTLGGHFNYISPELVILYILLYNIEKVA